jgi:hypothetical protein
LAWRDPNSKDSIYCKNLLKMMDPYFLWPLVICQRGEEGGAAAVEAWDGGGAVGGARCET